MPLVHMALTRSSTERVETLDIGFLDDSRQRLLRNGARLQETWKIGALLERNLTVPARVSQSRSR